MWGHGYVQRYFEDDAGKLLLVWVKRWRCPACGAVYTMRPSRYWRRFLAPVKMILTSLVGKLCDGRWLPGLSRQRQQYWWRGLQSQSQRNGTTVDLATLEAEGIIVATHSLTDRQVVWTPVRAYRSFAATAPPGRE